MRRREQNHVNLERVDKLSESKVRSMVTLNQRLAQGTIVEPTYDTNTFCLSPTMHKTQGRVKNATRLAIPSPTLSL